MRSPHINRYLFALILSLTWHTASHAFTLEDETPPLENVAVIVFAQDKLAKRAARTAQTRLENILLDNGMTVLDQDQANKMKDIWKQLEDPGYFVTAEDFVENTEKYQIDGIIRVYLQADTTRGLANYYSATAQADIRFIDKGANVKAHTSVPMGAPGRPPSDGLTRTAALVNAVQRAVDEAATQLDLEVIDLAKPRALKFALEGPVPIPTEGSFQSRPANNDDISQHAKLDKKTWRKESVTCMTHDPSGKLGAVGGYIKDTNIRTRRRLYGSRIHLIDINEKRELTTYETSPVEQKKKRKLPGTSKILDCRFISNWRYLSAITGNHLFLWDTERGLQMSSIKIEGGIDEGSLDYLTTDKEDYLVIRTKGREEAYRITRSKKK